MMKRYFGIIFCALTLTVCALAFAACGCGGDGTFTDFKVGFRNGSAVFTWDCAGAGEFEVYKSPSPDGEFEFVEKTGKNSYSADDHLSYYVFRSVSGGRTIDETEPYSYARSTFGTDNVKVFAAEDDTAAIQKYIDDKYKRLIWDEFSEQRTAMLFLPGNYGDLTMKIGYYTTAAGLGYLPSEVSMKGLRKEESPIASGSLVNFWCGAENFSVADDALWCVSQATSLRRMDFKGNLRLDDGGYSSGGFLADSRIAGTVSNTTQQQWLARNSTWKNWTGVDINMVFAGTEGNIPDSWPNPRTTALEKTTRMREKPFVVFDENEGYGVFVPGLREDCKGVSWAGGQADGEFIGIDEFYIAHADTDTSATLNAALERGKHLLLTPGIYNIDEPLEITTEGAVVLGMGLATLRTADGNTDTCMRVSDVGGVKLAGILFDAGTVTDTLLEVGGEGSDADYADDPVCLSDLYFRMGGFLKKTTGADRTLVINSSDVIGDNFWLWRADHGMDASVLEPYIDGDGNLDPDAASLTNWSYWKSFGVGWSGEQSNYGRNGAVINGDNVTIYGLMAEHFGEYQTIWNGENGFMCFYQSETPYDAPDQAAWTRGNGSSQADQGYASYKVGDGVMKHTAYGIGVYFVCNTPGLVLDHAIEAPSNPGISLIHMVTANFKSSAGSGIRHIVNEYGKSVIFPYASQKVLLTSFIGGKVTN